MTDKEESRKKERHYLTCQIIKNKLISEFGPTKIHTRYGYGYREIPFAVFDRDGEEIGPISDAIKSLISEIKYHREYRRKVDEYNPLKYKKINAEIALRNLLQNRDLTLNNVKITSNVNQVEWRKSGREISLFLPVRFMNLYLRGLHVVDYDTRTDSGRMVVDGQRWANRGRYEVWKVQELIKTGRGAWEKDFKLEPRWLACHKENRKHSALGATEARAIGNLDRRLREGAVEAIIGL